jgi:hypothetical protein
MKYLPSGFASHGLKSDNKTRANEKYFVNDHQNGGYDVTSNRRIVYNLCVLIILNHSRCLKLWKAWLPVQNGAKNSFF